MKVAPPSSNGASASVGDLQVPNVDPQQLYQEISSNTWRFGFSQQRLLNPDELVGRKGLRIYREMLADDQVKAALSLKKHAILSTGWDVKPASNAPLDVEIADFVKHCFVKMDGSLDDNLLGILSALQFGFSCSELVYRPLVSGDFKGKIGLRAIKTRMPDQFAFRVDQFDNLLENGIEQLGKPMPSWKFAIFSAGKEFENYYGSSDLRAAYRNWWLKDFVMKAWGIFLDRYSVPLALGTYPAGNATLDAQITAFRSALENLQLATTMTMPNDFKVDFPAVGAQGSQVFALAIDRQDAAIARAILVPNMLGVSPQGDHGGYSQAKKHFDVFILVVEKLQRDLSETVVGEQIIRRLVDLNYRVEEYPQFVMLPFTETDKAQLMALFFQAITAGGVRPRPEDEVHIRMVTEFPDVSLEELQTEAEKATNPAGSTPPANTPEGKGPQENAASSNGGISEEELNALIDEALGQSNAT